MAYIIVLQRTVLEIRFQLRYYLEVFPVMFLQSNIQGDGVGALSA